MTELFCFHAHVMIGYTIQYKKTKKKKKKKKKRKKVEHVFQRTFDEFL